MGECIADEQASFSAYTKKVEKSLPRLKSRTSFQFTPRMYRYGYHDAFSIESLLLEPMTAFFSAKNEPILFQDVYELLCSQYG
jgi:hypothetical protein